MDINGQMKVFPENSLLTEEYESIRDLISANCISEMGRQRSQELWPWSDPDIIRQQLSVTGEMMQIVEEELPFPFSGYIDTTAVLAVISIQNSAANESQFMALRMMLSTADDIFRFFSKHTTRFNMMRTSILGPTKPIKKPGELIDNVLDQSGQVKNSASPELGKIRRSLQRSRVDADKAYQTAINRLRKQGWTADAEESSRNGRRVIAVVAEQKRTVKGIVHDASATGKTVFIEPVETIGINNDILELEQQEKLEIYRILKELTSQCRPYKDHFYELHEILGKLDLQMAKARFARYSGASIPAIEPKPGVELKKAYHPLLYIQNKKQKQETVPFDIELDSEQRILVISGPNAGGKTVCMKTIGLLQLMVQSGIPVTCNSDSTFGVFNSLMVDIGDAQSIEYELSTYSSRLRHMKVFLENASDKTLFLIDEFGTGTDPNLGGALAEAVLEDLNNRVAFGVITTHYLNLKVFADRTPGIINGSMEFDLKKLKPMFRLVVGKPGSSYTFLVAERSGLPKAIIKAARKKVPRKTLLLEKLLSEIEKEKLLLSSSKAEADAKNKQLKVMLEKYQQLSEKTANDHKVRSEQFQKSEHKLRKESEEQFRNFLKEWKKSKDKKEVFDKYYRKFVKKKPSPDSKESQKKKEEKLKKLRELIKPGSRVRLENGYSTGIVDKIENDRVFVLFGDFKTQCDLISLKPVEDQ